MREIDLTVVLFQIVAEGDGKLSFFLNKDLQTTHLLAIAKLLDITGQELESKIAERLGNE